jgi:NTE family protein
MGVPPATAAQPAIALVLQGGGALGAYHIGAYQALEEHDMLPSWLAGISIGAVNATVIAGNPPAERVGQLAGLWEAISWPDLAPPLLPDSPLTGPLQTLHAMASVTEALLFGQPHFFAPRLLNPWLRPPAPPQDVSFYDLTPLTDALRHFADFTLINRRAVRLSLGATPIETGDLMFFDNHRQAIVPQHVLASCSLPPGFAATLVDGVAYWDGGCVTNTPLDAVTGEADHAHLVVFVIDLWNAAGPLPETMNDVLWRAKSIQYASRTALHIDAVATRANLRHAMRQLEGAAAPHPRLDIVHIVYRPDGAILPNSDAEFSRGSIAERRAAGYRDMQTALAAAPWMRQPKPAHGAALVHRVERGTVTTQAATTQPAPYLAVAAGGPRPASANRTTI